MKKGIKLAKLEEQLSLLSEGNLDEVIDFIEFILSKKDAQYKKNIQLEGIWSGKGFEKIDIEKELDITKKELSNSIMKKEL